jgi:hypothetical protein
MTEYTVNVENGNTFWYLNGKPHREDGPAVEYANGDKRWYRNDKLHREDGPAVENANGDKLWYLNNNNYSKKDFNLKMCLCKKLTIVEIEKLLGYSIAIVK